MPTSDSPGVMMPGQFGPMMRVLLPLLDVVGPRIGGVLHRDALGDDDEQRDLGVDGLDHRVLGERRRHEGDRHVGAGLLDGLGDACRTPAARRRCRPCPCASTVVPALRALTPPTTWVPALSISAVCLVPSPPVMPWTMTLESLLRKIDMSLRPLLRSASSAALSAPSSMVSARVTSGWLASREDARGPPRRCCRRGARRAAWSRVVAEHLRARRRCRWPPRRTR